SAAYATGFVTIVGSGSGTVSVTINGFTKSVTPLGSSLKAADFACQLSTAFNNDQSSPVTATVSLLLHCGQPCGSKPTTAVIAFRAKVGGSAGNYALSATATTGYTATPSGATLTGGSGATGNASSLSLVILGSEQTSPVFDQGAVSITINGFTATGGFGQSTTASAIASNLADVFNNSIASPVIASANGASLVLTSRTVGSPTNYSVSTNVLWDIGHFPRPSFTATKTGTTPSGPIVGTVTISGSERTQTAEGFNVADAGTIWVAVNGV